MSLINKIIEASNVIAKNAIKGSGGYIVTSTKTATMFHDYWTKIDRIEIIKKIKSKISNGKN